MHGNIQAEMQNDAAECAARQMLSASDTVRLQTSNRRDGKTLIPKEWGRLLAGSQAHTAVDFWSWTEWND